jgi:hypothetical protein
MNHNESFTSISIGAYPFNFLTLPALFESQVTVYCLEYLFAFAAKHLNFH